MNNVPPAGPGKPCAFPGVPEYFTRVLGDIEREILPLFWKLQKNVDGFSLSLTFPAKHGHRHTGRRHLGNVVKKRTTHASKTVNKDTLSREQDHTKSSSCATSVSAPTHGDAKPKRKSPSCKQRDRNRRKSWRRRKRSLAARHLDKQPCEISINQSRGGIRQLCDGTG
jgi:hypothetical protein